MKKENIGRWQKGGEYRWQMGQWRIPMANKCGALIPLQYYQELT
jgi:hypothetical protein